MSAAEPSPGPDAGRPRPRREDLLSMDRAARLLGVSIHVAWRRIERHGIEVHAVEWDGRRVQAVLRSAVLALRRAPEQAPPPAEDQAPRSRSLRVRPVRSDEDSVPRSTADAASRGAPPGAPGSPDPLLGEVQDILRERDLLRMRVDNMAAELDALSERPAPAELENELARQAGENAVLRERLRSFEVSREELASELDDALRRVRVLEDERDRARADSAHFESQNARLQSAETRLEAAIQELELTGNELAVERERARLAEDLRTELREVSADRERLLRDLRAARTESKDLAKTVKRLQADANSSARYLDKLERKLRAAKERARRSKT